MSSGYSRKNIWGGYDHYDEKGKKIGSSIPGFLGYTDYDAKGNKVGTSHPSLWGGFEHYDNIGNKTGSSRPDLFLTGFDHYDSKGNKTGHNYKSIFDNWEEEELGFGTSNGSQTQGCYIATCVYESYDCPQVWTLRRFRDKYLATRRWGRAFIRLYYCISPRLVAKYGSNTTFRRIWRSFLDKLIGRLMKNGYQNTPYADD